MQGPVAKYMFGSQGSPPVKGSSGQRADVEALGQAHINAVAGACLSIGIKFAGSANAAAEQVLRHYVLYFLKAKLQDTDSSQGTACYSQLGFTLHMSCACMHEKVCSMCTWKGKNNALNVSAAESACTGLPPSM